ncbi:MAG: molybdopterin converting factor subunit 1 [Dehalococcoidia bacterium]
MTTKVLFFAGLYGRTGVRETTVELPQGSTVSELYQGLCQRFPGLADYRLNLLYAVNAEYVTASYLLHDGDEVAFIPPVSGGGRCSSR